jgi:hypothetical protein
MTEMNGARFLIEGSRKLDLWTRSPDTEVMAANLWAKGMVTAAWARREAVDNWRMMAQAFEIVGGQAIGIYRLKDDPTTIQRAPYASLESAMNSIESLCLLDQVETTNRRVERA